ncbi:hypothetical protein BDY24DRAFT_404063 [Mrakia frigida]|uniref:uncharacterized protein n=1 Tax=Mrakia frigida TaxID=29902 RepID=UPI003FCBEF8B
MTSTFTPITIDMDKPRDWASDIAMLDWDKSSICFTKRNFFEFLKSVGVTVGPNFTEVNKLPKYATFGKIATTTTATPVASDSFPEGSEGVDVPMSDVSTSLIGNSARPSRRVREQPGGSLFGDEMQDDSPAAAPPAENSPPPTPHAEKYSAQPVATQPSSPTPAPALELPPVAAPVDEWAPKPTAFRPSRRVREGPGGASSMADMLSGGYDDAEQFEQSNYRTGKKQQP